MIIHCNANLFRIANLTSSTEETRYYLNGVFVMPHQLAGVLLISTDGHRMTVLHDETGRCDRASIIRLTPDALKLCKLQKNDVVRTVDIQIEENGVGAASLYDNFPGEKGERQIVGISAGNCIVDGTFPDWRRVLPKVDFAKPASAAFNGAYLADFAKMAKDIRLAFNLPRYDSNHNKMPDGLTVYASDKSGPALVRWCGVESAFGVLMPVRSGNDAEYPAFLNAAPADAKAAA